MRKYLDNNSSCGCSTTTSSCGCAPTCAPVSVSCNTGIPGQLPVTPPTITLENLLQVIETKCDGDTCRRLKKEMNLLYALLGVDKPPVDPTTPVDPPVTIPPINNCPVGQHWDTSLQQCMMGPPPQACPVGEHWDRVFQKCVPNCPTGYYWNGTDCTESPHLGGPGDPNPDPYPIPPLPYQLIRNMTNSLSGDLTDLYPSAEVLKEELMKLWRCLYDKQQHHGDWDTNFKMRDVSTIDDLCLLDGGQDPAPGQIKVIVPVDVGSTVFHTIEGRKCLFESLVDNNVTEPSKLAVLDGLWINYCDVKDVIDCVLPRTKITDCHQACDDPNHDGVFEDKTLCERVDCIETQICNTDCVVGVPTLCERVTKNEADIVKLNACVFPVGKPTLCERVTDLENCTICTVVDTNSVDLTKTPISGGIGNSIKADVVISPDAGNQAVVQSNGLYVGADSGLPAGAITFVDTIDGTLLVVADEVNPTFSSLPPVPADPNVPWGTDIYEFWASTKTFSAATYPYLAQAGQKLILSINASISYFMEMVENTPTKVAGPFQWGVTVYVNGHQVLSTKDCYALNQSGHWAGLSDNNSVTITTDGHDMEVKFVYKFIAMHPYVHYTKGDSLNVDMGSATILFSPGKH